MRTSWHRSVRVAACALVIVAIHAGCGAKGSGQPGSQRAPSHDIDAAGMDRAVRPGDDFYAFANGAWLKRAEIPPDRASAGIWADLSEQAARDTHELIESLVGRGAPSDPLERKVADYYASYMDERAIETQGLEPLRGLLNDIAAIADRGALTNWVCGSLRTDVDPLNNTNFSTEHLFGVWISQDLNQPDRYAPYLLQGGLGLPDRDYYVEPSSAMEAIRASYRAHIGAMLALAGIADSEGKAARIAALERRIAEVHATRTDSADVLKGNHPWTRGDFSARAPGIDWPACFAAAGLQDAPQIIVWHPRAVTGIAALVGREPIDTWRDYLAFHLVDHYSGVLPTAFVDQRFRFYGKTLSGTPQIRDRWKRAIDSTNEALGDAVGRLYVARHFPPPAKARLLAVVKNIVAAFERRVDALTWMNPTTKVNAKAKLSTLIVGIGYPDTWRDYSALEVKPGEALMNLRRAELFDYQQRQRKLGHAVDRSEWWLTPQTVNALNLPLQNALDFPAAILRPPFYDPDADAAVIYGAIGAIIGHEISHSFDDQGSQFDASGKLRNWWTAEDFAHFKDASAKLVSQYNGYTPLPDLHVNGQLTLSENIADLAGLAAAYDAYKASAPTPVASPPGGFSADQRFFISFAQAWRSKTRDELLRQLIIADGHAPDRLRASTVRNIDAWYQAFDVERGQTLYLAPAERVRVW